jgi:hypothetical protein
MRRRRLLLGALAGGLLLGSTAAAAQDPPRIKPGVSAAGIDLSGLTVQEAAAKLDAELLPRLQGDFVLTTAGRHWPLTMKEAGLELDSTRTAKRALYAKAPAAGTPVAVAPRDRALPHGRQGVRRAGSRPGCATRRATPPRTSRCDGSR